MIKIERAASSRLAMGQSFGGAALAAVERSWAGPEPRLPPLRPLSPRGTDRGEDEGESGGKRPGPFHVCAGV